MTNSGEGRRKLTSRDRIAIAETRAAERAEREHDRELVQQAKAEREIKKSPVPTKRRQPKIKRLLSRRQRIAESQTKFWFKAGQMSAIDAEQGWNATPTIDPEKTYTTLEVGPSDVHNPAEGYRTGKGTGPQPAGYAKTEYRPRKPGPPGSYGGRTRRQPKVDIAELTKQYL